MYCDNCGAELDRGQAYCTKCGMAVQQTYVNQPANPTPAYQAPPTQNDSTVPILAVVCTVLAMLVIGLGLVAGGVVKIGDSKAAKVEQAAAKSTSTPEKNVESTSTSSSKSSDSEHSEGSSSSSSSSSNSVATPEPAPTPAPAPSNPPRSSGNSGYVLPDSASRYYSASELSGYDNWTLYLARNEIYARHGRGFVREDLQEYFGNCSWYTRRIEPDDFVEREHFNDYEYQNALTIRSVEESRGSPYL